MKDPNQAVEELTLMLMYLTSFSETVIPGYPDDIRSWKGYPFSVMDKLANDELIYQGKRPSKSKSISFNDEGLEKAKELLKEYDIADWESEG
ncbi:MULTISPECIES: DUF6429 family protein [unclassified Breznakia]|uniref:DUF6429 family protein n=1 Tax=unclassified Breznakia TaxID=2623764 RepID=UPI002475E62B|nr:MULTISPECIES: DUF6429 family protein [unclassified Breznakia]MDH6368041.1 hypothetical protein [Breznakia sp. PH1-1]MDH6405129.1 hypothetical protein [Breznakia sp. PF1-11]MDH6412844.1 hypothetical protein [Breznakia sp. PFB1-11]MDH6415214.1 hypothetical protein [Breznakia sp. PFB1-14]MDH6417524.1 hypothetical protein [Breznakia sp. PFB1-4]